MKLYFQIPLFSDTIGTVKGAVFNGEASKAREASREKAKGSR